MNAVADDNLAQRQKRMKRLNRRKKMIYVVSLVVGILSISLEFGATATGIIGFVLLGIACVDLLISGYELRKQFKKEKLKLNHRGLHCVELSPGEQQDLARNQGASFVTNTEGWKKSYLILMGREKQLFYVSSHGQAIKLETKGDFWEKLGHPIGDKQLSIKDLEAYFRQHVAPHKIQTRTRMYKNILRSVVALCAAFGIVGAIPSLGISMIPGLVITSLSVVFLLASPLIGKGINRFIQRRHNRRSLGERQTSGFDGVGFNRDELDSVEQVAQCLDAAASAVSPVSAASTVVSPVQQGEVKRESPLERGSIFSRKGSAPMNIDNEPHPFSPSPPVAQ